MNQQQHILIGSDSSVSLMLIMNSIKHNSFNYITALRTFDILNIVTTTNPKLIILNYINNAKIIEALIQQVENPPPILCLSKNLKSEQIIHHHKLMVFTQSFNDCIENNSLTINILSLLKTNRKTAHNEPVVPENKSLARYVLELDKKKATIKNIKNMLKELSVSVDLKTRQKLNSILNRIKFNMNDASHWEDFKVYFESINPNFIQELLNRYPSLTTKDLKYCCYLKMNMSNEDIRNILGINKESVRTHKYRLKKKLTLQKEEDLKKYISSF